MAAVEIITNSELSTETKFWSSNVDDAFAEARTSDKYVMIAFGAEWARSWKLAVALAFMNEAALDLSRKFQCVMVGENWPSGKRTAEIYGVSAFPTVVICTAQGHVIYRASGVECLEDLVPVLAKIVLEIVERNAVVEKARTEIAKLPRTAARRPSAIRNLMTVLAQAILG